MRSDTNQTMTDNTQLALRVAQLDASELDDELFQVLKTKFNSIFKYFRPGLLAKVDPELNAIIKLVLWKYSLQSLGSTIGQTLLDLKYRNEATTSLGQLGWISRRQKYLFAFLMIGIPWVKERLPSLLSLCEKYLSLGESSSSCFVSAVDYAEKVGKVVSLVNFLVFLQQGKYQHIAERIIQVRPVYARPIGLRQVGFEFMDRELLWHGFAEFLFFILPLINFRKIKNYFTQFFLTKKGSVLDSIQSGSDLKECAICTEWPYNPQEIGCCHVFCYYCIQSNIAADPAFCCPLCGAAAADSKLTPVKIQARQKSL